MRLMERSKKKDGMSIRRSQGGFNEKAEIRDESTPESSWRD